MRKIKFINRKLYIHYTRLCFNEIFLLLFVRNSEEKSKLLDII